MLPRDRGQYAELTGGTAAGMFSLFIITVFFVSGLQGFLLKSANYASVVSAVLVDLANSDRASEQINGLKMNPLLVQAAQAKANDMAAKGYFAHTSPQGLDSWYWFKQVGYNFEYAGENLAVDFSDSGDVNQAWLNSPSHRENIMNSHFTEIGIATAAGYYQGHPTVFVVQMFGAPLREPAPVQKITQVTSAKKATELAIATTKPVQKVLGESAQAPEPQSGPSITVRPYVPAEKTYAPSWGYGLTSPKSTLKYAYYALGVLLLAALWYVTRFEMRTHHVKHYALASVMVAFMFGLFFLANLAFFGDPTVAQIGAYLQA